LDRGQLVVAAAAAFTEQLLGIAEAAGSDLAHVSLREAGFAPDLEARLDKAIADKRIWNIHDVVLLHKGRLVLARYFEGEDATWGRALGRVAFNQSVLHDLRSVSKSVVDLLYGIALAEGKVPPPEVSLLQAFPEYPDLAADQARAHWTVRHVLTMTMGTEWDESSAPYTDPTNSEIAMERAPDRYRYVLDRPIVTEPGKAGFTAVVQQRCSDA